MSNQPENSLPGQATLEQALKKHLQKTQMPAFSDYLFNKVIGRIEYETRLKDLKPKLFTALGFFMASLCLLFFAFDISWHAFGQTGISKYFSLLFTDFGQVTANWQDFSYSILDSLPLGATALLLGGILGSILLIDYGSHQVANFRKLISGGHYGNK